MDSTSPYAPTEYFEFPSYDNYQNDASIVQVDALHNTDNRFSFSALNTLQLSAGQPYYQPPSYLHAVRNGAQHNIHAASSDPEERELSPINSISPPLTSMSTSDLSGADSSASINALPPYQTTAGGRSTGTSSPSSNHGQSTLVHRRALRNNTHPMHTSPLAGAGNGGRSKRAATRRSTGSSSTAALDDEFASDEDDMGPTHGGHEVAVTKRREEVRKQRIESEQRRRDELRDGYRRLKDVLPVSNQKSSKVSLLDRATTHIRQLEMTQTHMIMKINELEAETARLRTVTETLMLNKAAQAAAARQQLQQQRAQDSAPGY